VKLENPAKIYSRNL